MSAGAAHMAEGSGGSPGAAGVLFAPVWSVVCGDALETLRRIGDNTVTS